jgi:TadE-like protein
MSAGVVADPSGHTGKSEMADAEAADARFGRARAARLRVPSRRRSSRSTRERGAALIELAIALPILVILVFGIVEFGVAYNDYISIRDGVRQAAREGSVGNFGPAATTGAPCHLTGATTASDNIKRLMCLTKAEIALDSSKVRVKVLTGAPAFSGTGTFAKNDSLIVCAQYPLDAITGVMGQFISDTALASKTAFRIEKSDIVATAGEETPPSGRDWSWCTTSADE